MKKSVAILLALFLCLEVLCACQSPFSDTDNGDMWDKGEDGDSKDDSLFDHASGTSDDGTNDSSRNKFSGVIRYGTPFSEGLAIISDGEKTYCIDTNGYIVFETDAPSSGSIYSKGYQNGLAMIDGNLYDKNGHVTTPEDVGVTTFYDFALSEGYIVAVKEEATYNSFKISLGILNTHFEWVTPLNEKLYASTKKLLESPTSTYTVGDYIINENNNIIYEIKTTKCYSFDSPPADLKEYGWTFSNGSFMQGSDTVFTTDAINAPAHWVNGKHVLIFYNKSAKKYYFTLVDTNGAFAFEPVELPALSDLEYGSYGAYDGHYIVVTESAFTNSGWDSRVAIYDTHTDSLRVSDNIFNGHIIYYGGVIVVKHDGVIQYYDLNFNPLF